MNDVQAKLDYADSVADWFLELAEGHARRGQLEDALKCAFVAVAVLYKHNRSLASARVESLLQLVAERLPPAAGAAPRDARKTGGPQVCLHVLTEAFPAGGCLAMARRWISNDRSGRVHHVALLSQRVPVPASLQQAVAAVGGAIHLANPDDSHVNRALWLRALANSVATHVVLHVETIDVICGAAFGLNGGPPIVTVNHSAHTFWTGASITDMVANCRGSAYEAVWTGTHRDVPRQATVPIPLEPQEALARDVAQKRAAREALGVPADAFVILTVGAFFKFLPGNGLDFVRTFEGILKRLPRAYLLAAGFQGDQRWQDALRATGARIRTCGVVPQSELAVMHAAADIYVEGFPFGTTTAMLEAGLKGIPVVLAPAQCPPPYGSDGVAVDGIVERASTLDEYETAIVRLHDDPDARNEASEKIHRSVASHHTGPGWQAYVEKALRSLPGEHAVRTHIAPERTPAALHEYWSRFVETIDMPYEETLERAVTRAMTLGLRPRLTAQARAACEEHGAVRMHATIPLPLLALFCNGLLPVLPLALSRRLFGVLSALYRRALWTRLGRKLRQLAGGRTRRAGWWEAYRQARD